MSHYYNSSNHEEMLKTFLNQRRIDQKTYIDRTYSLESNEKKHVLALKLLEEGAQILSRNAWTRDEVGEKLAAAHFSKLIIEAFGAKIEQIVRRFLVKNPDGKNSHINLHQLVQNIDYDSALFKTRKQTHFLLFVIELPVFHQIFKKAIFSLFCTLAEKAQKESNGKDNQELTNEFCNAKQWNFGVFFDSNEKLTFIKIWFQIDNETGNSLTQKQMQQQQQEQNHQEHLPQQQEQNQQNQQAYSPSQLELRPIQPLESLYAEKQASVLKRSRSVEQVKQQHEEDEHQLQQDFQSIDTKMADELMAEIWKSRDENLLPLTFTNKHTSRSSKTTINNKQKGQPVVDDDVDVEDNKNDDMMLFLQQKEKLWSLVEKNKEGKDNINNTTPQNLEQSLPCYFDYCVDNKLNGNNSEVLMLPTATKTRPENNVNDDIDIDRTTGNLKRQRSSAPSFSNTVVDTLKKSTTPQRRNLKDIFPSTKRTPPPLEPTKIPSPPTTPSLPPFSNTPIVFTKHVKNVAATTMVDNNFLLQQQQQQQQQYQQQQKLFEQQKLQQKLYQQYILDQYSRQMYAMQMQKNREQYIQQQRNQQQQQQQWNNNTPTFSFPVVTAAQTTAFVGMES